MTDIRRPTAVRDGLGTHLFLWTVFPLLGAGTGWVLSQVPSWLALLPEWVLHLPFLPGPEPVAALANLSGPVLTGVLTAAGLLAGALVTLSSYDEMVTVEIDGGSVRVTRKETVRIARDRVGAAFVDGKDLVVLGPDTAELVRERTGHSEARLRAAFEEHGHTWLDADPCQDDYRRWFDGVPGLEQGAQAILRARQAALEAKESAEAAELRTELARLGVVVRDEGKRQYWRTVR
ncbi:YqeB family protein [Nocardiopsis algeriensis]|uniref:DUF308 domain-containing protein n=1 Tax=Nocardiopsis algeriensis TaxID=1478215 RepID=A0A841IV43_9ACTN|nr:hypothetical protein [Nocardiopsis algeriensis]MBB6121126.1 hypothetical protein [Nocardiopsis algeriensis]